MSETPTLYKVLRGQSPCHGGSAAFVWPLPTRRKDGTWEPGAWTEVTGPLSLYSHGLHLTSEPFGWFLDDSQVYEAEYEGELVYGGGDKRCVRKARLLAPARWADFGIWAEGEHTISEGHARASGSATVEASGSATVVASGSATVVAYDSATVVASGSATVISTHWHVTTAGVALSQMAAHVDRRDGMLTLRHAVEAA